MRRCGLVVDNTGGSNYREGAAGGGIGIPLLYFVIMLHGIII